MEFKDDGLTFKDDGLSFKDGEGMVYPLLTAGYFPTTYFVAGYWPDDFWANVGGMMCTRYYFSLLQGEL